MNNVIEIRDLSKIYRLGEIGTGTLSRDLERWYRTKILGQEDPFLKIGEDNARDTKGSSNIVYSLRDISFDIQQGDSLGIIGKNGAGKSTLLKIITRITSPTTGKIKIKGRVASLLEVGTGFHPELTGRENIYLNGAILGMRKNEITRKLDEIIDFSGVERYIDTPVKRYSSGMYVRLAFAVAAHLDSEILIVDEVLAVGDAEFQNKCLGKMGEVSRGEGRTVLFVSHNMGAIKNLCSRGFLLKEGRGEVFQNISECISMYNKSMTFDKTKENEYVKPTLIDTLSIEILSLRVVQDENYEQVVYDVCKEIKIEINYIVRKKIIGSHIYLVVNGLSGEIFWSFDTDEDESLLNMREPGKYKTAVLIPKFLLKPGSYSLRFGAGISNSNPIEDIRGKISFKTEIISRNSSHLSYSERRNGLVGQSLNWQTFKIT